MWSLTIMREWTAKEAAFVVAFLVQFAAIIIWGAKTDSALTTMQTMVTEVRERAIGNSDQINELELQIRVDNAVRQALQKDEAQSGN